MCREFWMRCESRGSSFAECMCCGRAWRSFSLTPWGRRALLGERRHESNLGFAVDAYRDLNSRKMFWIVLAISGLVAGSMAAIGLSQNGFTVFGYELAVAIPQRSGIVAGGIL